jgi:DNA-binding CsgD family transcriptional regulator
MLKLLQKYLEEFLIYSNCRGYVVKPDYTVAFKEDTYGRYKKVDADTAKALKKKAHTITQEDLDKVLAGLTDRQSSIFNEVLKGKTATEIGEKKDMSQSLVLTVYKDVMAKFVMVLKRRDYKENPDSVYNYCDEALADSLVKKGYSTVSKFKDIYETEGYSGLEKMNGVGKKTLEEGIIPMLIKAGVEVEPKVVERKVINIGLAVDLLIKNKAEIKDFDRDKLTEILATYTL